MVYMSSDNEIVVTTRRGPGYASVSIAFSDLRYSHKAEEDLKAQLSQAFGPIAFNTWADMGVGRAARLLFRRFDARAPDRRRRRCARSRDRVISTWEDRVAVTPRAGVRAARGAAAVQALRPHRDPQRPVSRVHQAGRGARGSAALRSARGAARDRRVRPDSAETATLKIYSPRPLGLTETLRTLENLALPVREEMSIPITLPDGRRITLERLKVEAPAPVIAAMVEGEDRLREALRALQEGRATDDPLNGLLMLEGLDWRERRSAAHAAQSPAADPAGADRRHGQRRAAPQQRRGRRDLGHVPRALRSPVPGPAGSGHPGRRRGRARRPARRRSLFDDEILQGFENLVHATVRTNAYQRPERPVFAIKVESGRVDGMVSPRPLFEIYVHSRQLEGIHLRGGKVARGGMRWSDRHDDFRTEILGLMKTQMVKNAIIVPVGSKGGFVLKGQLPPRPALDAYLVERYREFVSGLLDVTDNLVDGEVVHPPEVVRHDDDDPVPGRRGRQGHGAPVGHGQPGVGAVRLLARRRVRVGRQQRLRPQEGRHHGARRVGVHSPPFPQPRRRRADAAVHRAPASATWRATSSATAMLRSRSRPGSSPRSTISTSSSIRIPTRRAASPNARGSSSCRDRPGRTTTRRRSAPAAASSIDRRRRFR